MKITIVEEYDYSFESLLLECSGCLATWILHCDGYGQAENVARIVNYCPGCGNRVPTDRNIEVKSK